MVYRFSPAAFLFLSLNVTSLFAAQNSDPFLTDLYDRLHNSPIQEKFRTIAPMPLGAVYIQHPGEGEEEMRWHFRTMRRLGFTATKQIQTLPGWTFERVARIALDENIIPWWYGEGGWEPITGDLLEKLGIPNDLPIAEIRSHPKMQEYQRGIMLRRIDRLEQLRQQGQSLRGSASIDDVGGWGFDLSDEAKPQFVRWVERNYKTIDRLNHAWNQHHYGHAPDGEPFESWKDFRARWEKVGDKEYRHLRDILRFKCDFRIDGIRRRAEAIREFDPNIPFRAGGEAGYFLPHVWYAADMEGIADLMTAYGSLYPSIHLAWHFDEVGHEIARTVYMQAAHCHDYFKGGWSAPWESTGGPQQFSGGKGGATYTVDEGVMTQLMLSYLAAGFKGFGLWCWSARTAGWEAGEYALLDRQNEVTDRAIRVGQIGRAAHKYRDELWDAHKEPLVGVYTDFENDAVWAAMAERGRIAFRQEPVRARVGVCRALINGNIPFEYVTADDLRNGLGGRYRIIYMPLVIAIPQEVMEILHNYVKEGGRLVTDMPAAYYDEYAALMSTAGGSTFERTFGAEIDDYQGTGVNRPYRLEGLDLQGFVLDLNPTRARVLAAYDTGDPAITEATTGKGTAVILGFEASRMCFEPDNREAEAMLLKYTLGDYEASYRCRGAIVYRLAAPEADHYFFINDNPERTVTFQTDVDYKSATDAVTGENVPLGGPIALERYSGRWLRFEKE